MFYFRLIIMYLWAFLGSIIGLVYALFNQKDPELFGKGLRIVSWGVLKIAKVKVVLEGGEHVLDNQPCVYVGNHQSALDVFTYAQIMPRYTTAVAKHEVRFLPIIGWWYWAIGGSFIHRKKKREAIQELQRLANKMNSHHLSVAMMPEGTRNKAGIGLLPFKKGPFHLAILGQFPLVPVLSSPMVNVANYRDKKIIGGTITIRGFKPISTKGLTGKDVDALSQKVRKIMLEGMRELGHPIDAQGEPTTI